MNATKPSLSLVDVGYFGVPSERLFVTVEITLAARRDEQGSMTTLGAVAAYLEAAAASITASTIDSALRRQQLGDQAYCLLTSNISDPGGVVAAWRTASLELLGPPPPPADDGLLSAFGALPAPLLALVIICGLLVLAVFALGVCYPWGGRPSVARRCCWPDGQAKQSKQDVEASKRTGKAVAKEEEEEEEETHEEGDDQVEEEAEVEEMGQMEDRTELSEGTSRVQVAEEISSRVQLAEEIGKELGEEIGKERPRVTAATRAKESSPPPPMDPAASALAADKPYSPLTGHFSPVPHKNSPEERARRLVLPSATMSLMKKTTSLEVGAGYLPLYVALLIPFIPYAHRPPIPSPLPLSPPSLRCALTQEHPRAGSIGGFDLEVTPTATPRSHSPSSAAIAPHSIFLGAPPPRGLTRRQRRLWIEKQKEWAKAVQSPRTARTLLPSPMRSLLPLPSDAKADAGSNKSAPKPRTPSPGARERVSRYAGGIEPDASVNATKGELCATAPSHLRDRRLEQGDGAQPRSLAVDGSVVKGGSMKHAGRAKVKPSVGSRPSAAAGEAQGLRSKLREEMRTEMREEMRAELRAEHAPQPVSRAPVAEATDAEPATATTAGVEVGVSTSGRLGCKEHPGRDFARGGGRHRRGSVASPVRGPRAAPQLQSIHADEATVAPPSPALGDAASIASPTRILVRKGKAPPPGWVRRGALGSTPLPPLAGNGSDAATHVDASTAEASADASADRPQAETTAELISIDANAPGPFPHNTSEPAPARVREGEESISARIARALAHANQRMKDASGDAKAAAARLEAEARAEAAAQTAAALVQAQRRPPGKRVV